MKNKLHILCIIILSFMAITVFTSPLFAWSGTIIDVETGHPIEGAVIIRSWDRELATAAGTMNRPVTFEETLSDKDGKFSISILKRLSHISIPIFGPIEENIPIVFKPGYKFRLVKEKSSVIKLEKLPNNYYLRYEEAEKARGNYQVDFHETKLLKKTIEDEKKLIESLNKYVPGVWYTGFISPKDIAIDQKNNVFVADGYNRSIRKLSQKEKQIRKSSGGSGGPIDIEIAPNGSLYSFKGRTLYYGGRRISFNGVPYGDVRFTLGQAETVSLIVTYKPFLFNYDLKGNLLCRQKVSNQNSTQFEGDIQLIDIDSTPNDMIIAAYAYRNPYRDRNLRRYVSRNGVLFFDSRCGEISYKELYINSKVRSIDATATGFVVVADKDSIYVYDKNINLLYKEKMIDTELGVVDIYRISSDPSGTYLYIIEGRYKRILKYNMITRSFSNK